MQSKYLQTLTKLDLWPPILTPHFFSRYLSFIYSRFIFRLTHRGHLGTIFIFLYKFDIIQILSYK
jgi:hypothetical protein